MPRLPAAADHGGLDTPELDSASVVDEAHTRVAVGHTGLCRKGCTAAGVESGMADREVHTAALEVEADSDSAAGEEVAAWVALDAQREPTS